MMSEIRKADSFHFRVNPFEDDFTGRLSWSVLGKHVLACAENHAAARGFDRLTLNGRRFLWVLSRMAFEMQEWPHRGEEYVITTWVRSYYRYFTDRCFDICRSDGKLLGRVFTIWAMIDEESRKPQVLEGLFGNRFDPYIDTERPCISQPFSRIRMREEAAPCCRRTTYFSDIDENNHVNSIRYIEFLLDTFPKPLLESRDVSRLEIAYHSESYCGDCLSFYAQGDAGDGPVQMQVRKNAGADPAQGETVCHALISFAPPRQAEVLHPKE